jgi:hypothetical protein
VLVLIAAWVAAELWPFVPPSTGPRSRRNSGPDLEPSLSVASATYHLVSVAVLGMMLESLEYPVHATRCSRLLVAGVLGAKLLLWASPLSLSFVVGTVSVWSYGRCSAIGSANGRGRAPRRVDLLLYRAIARAIRAARRARAIQMGALRFRARGEMSVNLRSLAASVFAFGAMLWLVDRVGGRITG